MKKRFFALLAAACLLLLGGCDNTSDSSAPLSDGSVGVQEDGTTDLQHFSLAYSHDDTLNPYALTTEVNAQLVGLLYDSLTVPDANLVPQFSLASAVEFTDATHLVATLRQGAVFSDGSAVTTEDVVASFTEAKKSARYRALLSNVADAKGDAQGQITFTLHSADPNAMLCLIYPVVKTSTLTAEPGMAPLGGGTYCLQPTDTGAQLVMNAYRSPKPQFSTVTLRHLPNNASRHYALASNEITYYFNDLSEGELPRVTGANRSVPMSAMVYLGINSSRAALSVPTVRQALSALLDRSAVCKTAYADWARASAQPFPSFWQGMSGLTADSPRDLDGAIAHLDEAGYTARGGKRMELELIYSTKCADRARVADLIRTQMEGAGVMITLTPLTEEEYLQRLKSGNYDLYLAEIRLTANMSLRPLLAGGDASYGVARSGAAAVSYGQYLTGEKTVEEFLTAFAEDMPYVPVCWRSGVAAFDRRLTTVTPGAYDPYAGFADWK